MLTSYTEKDTEPGLLVKKAWLDQARNINVLIDSKLAQVASLRGLALKVSSTISQTPVSGTHDPKRLENTIIRLMDLEHEVNRDVDRLVELKANIMSTINRVPDDRERALLELRYLSFQSWRYIADALGIHIRQVYRLHEEALEHVEIPAKWHSMSL